MAVTMAQAAGDGSGAESHVTLTELGARQLVDVIGHLGRLSGGARAVLNR